MAVALAAPVPTLLMRTARPAPLLMKFSLINRLLIPSNRRMSAVAAKVAPLSVLRKNVELTRLKA